MPYIIIHFFLSLWQLLKSNYVTNSSSPTMPELSSLPSQHLSDTVHEGHLQCACQAGTGQRVDLKRNVQSIDPNSVGLWFLILRPDFSQL